MGKKKLLVFSVLCALIFPVITYIATGTNSDLANGKTDYNKSTINITWKGENQKIEGFGVAEAGWVNWLFGHYKRDEIMDLLFGKDGLDLNILRGEVFPSFSESKGKEDFATSEDINIPLDDPYFNNIDTDSDVQRRGQLWVNTMATKKYNVDKLIYSVWSPPAYMKSNGSTSGGTLKVNEKLNYTNYLVDFIKAYKKYGLPVYALSPANEPEYPATWSSCVWEPSMVLGAYIQNYMGPIFKLNGIDTKIIFGENAQWSDWLAILGSRVYVNSILENYNIDKYPIIAAGHGYPNPLSHELTPIVPFEAAQRKNVPVWLTETAGLDDYDISMQNAINWANQWQQYLDTANASALVWWTGAVPGDNNEGLILTDRNRKDYHTSKRYETFGNFTRYIKEGSVRIDVNPDTIPDGVTVSAFKKDDEYTIVAVNNNSTPVLQEGINFDGISGISSMNRVLTDENNKWATTKVDPDSSGNYKLDIPAKSVVTFTGKITE